MYQIDNDLKAQIDAPSTSVVELLEVNFGGGLKRYWSTQQVLSNWYTYTEFEDGLQPWMFEPRILSIDTKEWVLLPDDSAVNITIADSVVGYEETIKSFVRNWGIDVFYSAMVHYHLLFPNLKGKDNVLRDVWIGKGAQLSIEEDVCSWEIRFGMSSLRRRFGRVRDTTCPHIFADQYECTYDLEKGRGLPHTVFVGNTQTGTSGNTIKLTSTSGLAVGMYVVDTATDKNIYARITQIVDSTTIAVTTVFGSGSIGVGDRLMIGFPFNQCPHTLAACKERGRYAPKYGDGRTEFGGNAPAAKIEYKGKIPEGDKFTRTRYAGETTEGSIVPVVYGDYHMQNVPADWYAPAGAFVHALFLLCEGRIYQMMSATVADLPPDNIKVNTGDPYSVIKDESWHVWGVGNLEDDRIVDEQSLYWALNCVGQRKSKGIRSGVVLDTYASGTNLPYFSGIIKALGHPYLFNDGNGEGVSLDGFAATRIRVETGSDTDTVPSGNFHIIGRYVYVPPGAALPPSSFKYTINGVQHWYTVRPNPALVALDILTNRRYGAGLSVDDIDVNSFVQLSNFCQERVGEVNSTAREFSSYVVFGPANATGHNVGNNWAIIGSIFPTGSLNGRRIRFYDSGFETVIAHSEELNFLYGQDANIGSYIPGIDPPQTTNYFGYTDSGTLLYLQDAPPTTIKSGDYVIVEPSGTVYRYSSNGIIASDAPIGDVVDKVLEEMGADFRYRQDGKIEAIVRRALTYSELQDVITNRLFTDRGSKRNIIRKNGKSSLKIWNEDVATLPNSFRAEVIAADYNYTNVTLVVFSEEAQMQRALLFDRPGARDKLEETFELIMTTNLDQAARRLALEARERYIENLYCSFSTSIKGGLLVQPGDVIAIDSDVFSMFVPKPGTEVSIGGAYLFRVTKKRLTSDFTCEFECKIHINDIYDDSATAFGSYFQMQETRIGGTEVPADVIPTDVREEVEIGVDGTVFDFIVVEFKFPIVGQGGTT